MPPLNIASYSAMPPTNNVGPQADARAQRLNSTEQRITDNVNARFDAMTPTLTNVQQTVNQMKEDHDRMKADIANILSIVAQQPVSPDPLMDY